MNYLLFRRTERYFIYIILIVLAFMIYIGDNQVREAVARTEEHNRQDDDRMKQMQKQIDGIIDRHQNMDAARYQGVTINGLKYK